MDPIQDLLKRADRTISSGTEAECHSLLREVDRQRITLKDNLAPLQYDPTTGVPGTVRAEALESGNPDAVLKVEAEQAQIEAQIELLVHRLQQLSEAETKYRIDEAPAIATAVIKELPAAVKDLAMKRDEYRDAKTKVGELLTSLRVAIRTRTQNGLNCPRLSVKQFNSIADDLRSTIWWGTQKQKKSGLTFTELQVRAEIVAEEPKRAEDADKPHRQRTVSVM